MSTTKTIKISQGKVLDYSITKDGFKPIIGSSLITSDKSINVNMVSTESESSVYNFGDRIGGIATVVGEYTDGDGKKYAFAVLDAKYRTSHMTWSTTEQDTGLPNYTSADAAKNAKESATYNTDYILNNYSASVYCGFNAARSQATITIGGKTYYSQLPNAYELQQIYNFRSNLDALDPTLSSYSNCSLASWNIGGNSNSCVWCSNEYDTGYALGLYSSGSWNNSFKYYGYFGIVPVLEIEI